MAIPVKKAVKYLDELSDPCLELSEFSVKAAIKDITNTLMLRSTTTDDAALLYAAMGRANVRLNKFEEACNCFRNAYRLAPSEPGNRNNMAVTMLRLGRTEEALKHFIELSEVAPTHIHLGNVAHALYELGHYDDAIDMFREAVSAADLKNAAHLLLLAGDAAEIGLRKEALELYARHLAMKQGVRLGDTPALDFILSSPVKYKACLTPALNNAIARAEAWDAELNRFDQASLGHRDSASTEDDDATMREFDETRAWRQRASSVVLGGDEHE
jgi:tetratricopeptide (TPR) repeat protein